MLPLIRAWMFSAARSGSEGLVGSRGSGSPADSSSPSAAEGRGQGALVLGHRRRDRDLDQLGARGLRRYSARPACVSRLECGEGMTTQLTCSGPSASTASRATRAESIPPESATPTWRKPFLRDVVAQAEDQRRVDLGQVGQRLGEPARGGGGDLAEQQLLLELRRAGDHCALRVDDEAVPVEDQLVLAADEVAEGEAERRRRGRARPASLRARVPCRGGRASPRGWRSGSAPAAASLEAGGPGAPDVLADRQADLLTGDLDRSPALARDEVALLVEDGVVGQPVLAVDGLERRRRRARRASCGRGGPRRPPAAGSAKPTRATIPSTPRASSSTARRLASTKWRFR